MPIFAADASNIDINRSRGRSRIEMHQIGLDSVPLPTSCPLPAALIPTGTLYTFDFNLPDDSSATPFGATWEYYHGYPNPPVTPQNNAWLQIQGNQASVNVVNPFRPPIVGGIDYEDRAVRAHYLPFPQNTKDQYSKITYRGTVAPAGVIGGANGYSVNMETYVRVQHFTTVPDGFFFESLFPPQLSNFIGYAARYIEQFNADGSFNHAQIVFGRLDINGSLTLSGIFNVVNAPFPFPRLTSGDTLQINAANSFQFGSEVVCLYVFVNGVQVAHGTDGALPILPNIQFGKILTGGVGAGNSGTLYDVLSAGWAQMNFDDFEASATLPNPV